MKLSSSQGLKISLPELLENLEEQKKSFRKQCAPKQNAQAEITAQEMREVVTLLGELIESLKLNEGPAIDFTTKKDVT